MAKSCDFAHPQSTVSRRLFYSASWGLVVTVDRSYNGVMHGLVTLPERKKAVIFLTEIIEIYRSFEARSDELAKFLGADSIELFEVEVLRLKKVVLSLSGAMARWKSYHDQLVESGAANVSWRCLEALSENIHTDELKPKKLAEWLLDYAEGKFFGTDIKPVEAETEAKMAEECGFLQPRGPDDCP